MQKTGGASPWRIHYRMRKLVVESDGRGTYPKVGNEDDEEGRQVQMEGELWDGDVTKGFTLYWSLMCAFFLCIGTCWWNFKKALNMVVHPDNHMEHFPTTRCLMRR